MRNEKSTKKFASYLMWKSWHSSPLALCLLYVIRNSICILYIWYIIRSLNLVERYDVLKFVRKMTYFVEFKKQAFSKTMNVQLIIVITIYIITIKAHNIKVMIILSISHVHTHFLELHFSYTALLVNRGFINIVKRKFSLLVV